MNRVRPGIRLFLPFVGAALVVGCHTEPRVEVSTLLAACASRHICGSASKHRSARSDTTFAALLQDDTSAGSPVSRARKSNQDNAEEQTDSRGEDEGLFATQSAREIIIDDLKGMPGRLWDHSVATVSDPLNLIVLGGGAATAVALHQHADAANAKLFEDENLFGHGCRDALKVAGNPGLHFAVAGVWYGYGLLHENEKTYDTGKKLIDALALNALTTLLIKVASNRERPDGDEHSFPSGHVSSSVTFATVMNHAYGPLVGVPLYGLSALVALERLDDRKHWVSDVAFGAALGVVIGHTVATGERPSILGGELAPYIDPDAQFTGVAWIKHF